MGKSDRSINAARLTDSAEGSGALGTAGIAAMDPPLLHAISAGTISVAIWPGAVRAAMMASAASRPRSDAAEDVRNHLEYGRAIASISDVSGAS